ncbi:MAG TPA: UDP-N-acetylmuramoylalanyl-D-glutamyl-2,6-diaminopimelate--D-alanyl-D-alanine ligase [Enterovirga sp.]|jgi:UDP-N-acetylmuramoyl-tripeptide--D-alanyl-D-alanine ligase|nr:UDP-N-acetylmuramoylalanyl-D-glutamyl-2,6-diaminopimelate--D-alanyl-D-alanine ligase [Enterovirga sp.]
MKALWTAPDLAGLPGARLVGDLRPITGVSIDTRTLAEGDLFFALKDARDGHDFVRDALGKGAAAAVIEAGRAAEFGESGPFVIVPDVLDAMRALGELSRARMQGRVVAVTGSVGKTGTKEALKLVLARFGATHASAASYNNHWGVPLTLSRMPADSAFGVFEIGMNHEGEIAPLTRMVRPHAAIVTTIEPVHIAHFRSILGIADAKGEIFAGLEPGGVAVITRDTPYYDRLSAHAGASRAGRIISFGEHEGADVRALRIAAGPDASMVDADVLGRRITYRIGMAGRHVALNSLAVIAAAAALGLDLAGAANAFADLQPPAGRGARTVLNVPGGQILVIDESYNANPASMRAALATLGSVEPGPGGRRIAVLADMLELGEGADAAHRGLAEPIEAHGIDLVFAAGPLMAELWPALGERRRGVHATDAAALEAEILGAVRPGDAIMIKGSNSTRISRIVGTLKTLDELTNAALSRG